MIRVIAIANQKGGCGKTTTTINLGACLARLNRRVLLVDLDPQAHTTAGLGILPEKLGQTLYHVLSMKSERKPSWEEVVIPLNPYLHLLPGDLRLHRLEEVYSCHPEKERQLKYQLVFGRPPLDAFDFILIDCPPNLGFLTLNALEAAEEVVIPIEPSFFSLHGLAKMSETLQGVAEKRGHAHQTRALVTLYDAADRFSQEVFEEVKRHFQDRMFRTLVHENGILREAAGAGLSIVDFDPHSAGYRDYMSLATEVLESDSRSKTFPPEASVEGWRRSIGPRKVTGGILFQYFCPEAKQVLIAGDFNQWVATPLLRRNSNGLWQRIVPLREGGYRYKYLVDGEWKLDPAAPEQKENPYGNRDSYLELNVRR